MIKDIHLVEKQHKPLSMNPQKFILWMFIVASIMIFASLTSAYIVRQSEGNWLQYELPTELWLTTGVILLSSLTMHLAYAAGKKNNIKASKLYMVLTAALGVVFLIGQFYIWGILTSQGVYFVGNPGGSFLYVLTGMHGFHIISGLVFLGIMLFKSFTYKIKTEEGFKLGICAGYWHFLDVLWVYLFIFLLLNH